jgi:hypothetical protein
VLMDRLWLELGSFHECLSGMGSRDGGYEQTATPRLLSSNVASISVFTNHYCGGAHPDFGDAPIDLDAGTVRSLSLEAILWVDRGKPFHDTCCVSAGDRASAVDFDTCSNYRSTDFAPWLEQALAAAYPSIMTPGGSEYDDECTYDDPRVWRFPGFYLTPKGVFLGTSVAQASVTRTALPDDSSPVLDPSPMRYAHRFRHLPDTRPARRAVRRRRSLSVVAGCAAD